MLRNIYLSTQRRLVNARWDIPVHLLLNKPLWETPIMHLHQPQHGLMLYTEFMKTPVFFPTDMLTYFSTLIFTFSASCNRFFFWFNIHFPFVHFQSSLLVSCTFISDSLYYIKMIFDFQQCLILLHVYFMV